jgi:rare lipoprotein A
MTAAHRTLRFGTRVEVTHVKNGRSVEVRINDRGPYRRGRIIDVSRAAAAELGMKNAGLARVEVQPIHRVH